MVYILLSVYILSEFTRAEGNWDSGTEIPQLRLQSWAQSSSTSPLCITELLCLWPFEPLNSAEASGTSTGDLEWETTSSKRAVASFRNMPNNNLFLCFSLEQYMAAAVLSFHTLSSKESKKSISACSCVLSCYLRNICYICLEQGVSKPNKSFLPCRMVSDVFWSMFESSLFSNLVIFFSSLFVLQELHLTSVIS